MNQLRALRVFTQVIAEGSFSGAARLLDLAPAVVTRSVADLEEHLGARLLNRTTRKLALTEIGEAYLEHARRILAELDEADAMAGSATQHTRGSLRVVCPPAFAVHQLARHLPRFRALHPHIALELSTPGPVSAADDNFDVSILSIGAQPLDGDFVVRRLVTSAFVLCASPEFLKRCGTPETPSDLARFDGVLPAVAAIRQGLTLFRHAAPHGQAPDESVTIALGEAALTTHNIDMMLAGALAGLGIAGLPSFVAASALEDGQLVRILPGWRGLNLSLYAAVPSRKYLPARTRAFVDFLVQTFGGRDEDPWLRI